MSMLSTSEMDPGLARMNLPELRINYDPIDPDQFDRPITSFCIETGEDNDELSAPLTQERTARCRFTWIGYVSCPWRLMDRSAAGCRVDTRRGHA
ncbi:hypothetical protein [Bradyrhizobium sp. JR3.5]